MDNIFDRRVCDTHIARINRLHADTEPLWGKMNAGQMLAHVSKPYEMVCDPDYARTHKRPPTPIWNNLFAKHLDHHLRQFGV